MVVARSGEDTLEGTFCQGDEKGRGKNDKTHKPIPV